MESPAEIVAEIRRDLQEIKTQAPLSNSTSGVHFHGSSGLTLIGVVLVVVALAAVAVIAAWRAADMREIEWLRAELATTKDDLKGVRAYALKHEGQINKLESRDVE